MGRASKCRFFREAAEKIRAKRNGGQQNVNVGKTHIREKKEELSTVEKRYFDKLPLKGDDFEEYDSAKLIEASEILVRENPNYSIEGNIERSINNFSPLSPELITALRFIAHVDAGDLVHYNKSEPLISVVNLIGNLRHSASEMKDWDERRRQKGIDTTVTFADIFAVRVEMVKKAAELAKSRPAKVSPSHKTGNLF